MKKLKIMTMVFVFGILNSIGFSQYDAEGRIRLGVKAGVNYSNIYDERGEDFVADGKLGFAGGAFVMTPIEDFFGVQPERLISQKGFKATGSLYGYNYVINV